MSELYHAIESERKHLKLRKQDISEQVGKLSTNTYFWSSIKSGNIRLRFVVKIFQLLKLELIIINPRKTRNSKHEILNDERAFYKCINIERLDFGYSNAEVAALVGAPTSRGNVWATIISLSLKYNHVVTICDALGLELIIRNSKNKISHLLNNPKIKK